MRYAIFSDIHNHTTALQAILNHARKQKIDRYFCLGDIGIDECVDLVRAIKAPAVFGNWEVSNWRHLSAKNQKWALKLPPMRKEDKFWLAHAAPFWPPHLTRLADLHANPHALPQGRLFPYLHNESPILWEAIAALTEAGAPLLFHGHTHRQVLWCFTGDNYLHRLTKCIFKIEPGQILIAGVGSVGNAQDGLGACYAIYDSEAQVIEMVRVV
jgi:predicted phosphodiesterase